MTRLLAGFMLLAALCLTAGGLRAESVAAFNAAVAEAYAPYRAAISYLRTGNGDLAAAELEAMIQAWHRVEAQFADAPPDGLAGDPAWRDSLTEVGRQARTALAAIDGGDLEAATTAAAPVRDILSALRQRHGIRVYSDCVDEITAAVDAVQRHRPPGTDLAPAAGKAMADALGELERVTRRCDGEATAERRENPEFRRLFDGMYGGIQEVREAIEDPGHEVLQGVLGKLRALDNIIFLRFG